VTAVLAPARRGRQRSSAADQAILAAALEVLAADGYNGLTMSAVIARAGVSSATLYRRWPTKQSLVAAALASFAPVVVAADTGTFEGDIAALIDGLVCALSSQPDDIVDDIEVALRRHPEFRAALNEKFLAPRLLVLERILARARRRGEIGPGLAVDVAYSIVSGPLHHRIAVIGKPATPAFRRTLTRAAVTALRAVSS